MSSVVSSVQAGSCSRHQLCLQEKMSKKDMCSEKILLVSYFCALERISKWSDTKVSKIEAKGQRMIESAMLTRSDGLKINLFPNSGCMFYVMNGDYGLEIGIMQHNKYLEKRPKKRGDVYFLACCVL